MPRQRSGRRGSRSTKRWWGAAAVVVSLSVAAGVIVVATSHNASPSQAMSSSAYRRQLSGWGHGGNFMLTGSYQQAAANAPAAFPADGTASLRRP